MSAQTAPADTALAGWQQSLLAALWAPTHDEALEQLAVPGVAHRHFMWRGIAAYRSHAAAQAVRSLGAAYPAVERLVGPENFEALSRLLWRERPPQGGDLAQWGSTLAAQIEDLPDLVADFPFLVDVALVEWAHAQHGHARRCPGRTDQFHVVGRRRSRQAAVRSCARYGLLQQCLAGGDVD